MAGPSPSLSSPIDTSFGSPSIGDDGGYAAKQAEKLQRKRSVETNKVNWRVYNKSIADYVLVAETASEWRSFFGRTNRRPLVETQRLGVATDKLLAALSKLGPGSVQPSNLPGVTTALDVLVADTLAMKMSGSIEQRFRPFVSHFVRNSSAKDLRTLSNHLGKLNGLIGYLPPDKYNRQDAHDVIQAITAVTLREMAGQVIVIQLGLLVYSLESLLLVMERLKRSKKLMARLKRNRKKIGRLKGKQDDQEENEDAESEGAENENEDENEENHLKENTAGVIADRRSLEKAWFDLYSSMQTVRSNWQEVAPVDCLKCGIEQLGPKQIKILGSVCADHVSPQARSARSLLLNIARLAEQETIVSHFDEQETEAKTLDFSMLCTAWNKHIQECLVQWVEGASHDLEKACGFGISERAINATERVIDRAERLVNSTWGNLQEEINDRGAHYPVLQKDNRDEVLECETKKYFAQALMALPSDKVRLECLSVLDNERLCAMAALPPSLPQENLPALVEQVHIMQYQQLQAKVDAARENLQNTLTRGWSDAIAPGLTAQRLLELSDTLFCRDYFVSRVSVSYPLPHSDDTEVDATLARAGVYFRLPGEAAESFEHASLGHTSLRPLDDATFGNVVHAATGNSVQAAVVEDDGPPLGRPVSRRFGSGLQSLQLSERAVRDEVMRRIKPFDVQIRGQLSRLVDALSKPGVSLTTFSQAIVDLVVVDVARKEKLVELGGREREDANLPGEGLLVSLQGLLYQHRPGFLPSGDKLVYIQGMLGILGTLRASFNPVKSQTQLARRRAIQRLNIAQGVLSALSNEIHTLWPALDQEIDQDASGHHLSALRTPRAHLEIAAQFGVQFDVARCQAQPLFGPVYQARLLAALVIAANHNNLPQFEAVTIPADGQGAMQVEQGFYREAYRTGQLSFSLAGPSQEEGVLSPLQGPQEAASRDAALVKLHRLAGEASTRLTHFMSIVVEALADFALEASHASVLGSKAGVFALQQLRHAHINISKLTSYGGFLFSVTAFIDTRDPQQEANLTFTVRLNPQDRMAIYFIRPMEMRMVPQASARFSPQYHDGLPLMKDQVNSAPVAQEHDHFHGLTKEYNGDQRNVYNVPATVRV